MIGFLNGNKIPLNADFVTANQGKKGEDLNDLTTTQVRGYQAAMSEVKNSPISSDGDWFSIQVIMQDTSNGIMLCFSDSERIFFRVYTHFWHRWHEISVT